MGMLQVFRLLGNNFVAILHHLPCLNMTKWGYFGDKCQFALKSLSTDEVCPAQLVRKTAICHNFDSPLSQPRA
jgi:hypothetical protein